MDSIPWRNSGETTPVIVISVLHRGDKTCVDVEHGLYLNLVAATQNVSHYFSIRMHKTHCPQGAPYGIRMEPMSVLWYLLGRLSSGTLNYWDSGWLWPEDRKIFFVETFFGKPLFWSRMGAEIVENWQRSYFQVISNFQRLETRSQIGNIRHVVWKRTQKIGIYTKMLTVWVKMGCHFIANVL